MSELPFRVLPAVDDTTAFFWSSGEDGQLRFLRCQDCGTYLHPPLPRCFACGSRELAAEPVSGRATVHSCTVNHQPWTGESEPWVIAVVELPEQEGLRLTTNIVGCEPDDVAIGMAVEVTFEHHDDDIWIPVFQPAGEQR